MQRYFIFSFVLFFFQCHIRNILVPLLDKTEKTHAGVIDIFLFVYFFIMFFWNCVLTSYVSSFQEKNNKTYILSKSKCAICLVVKAVKTHHCRMCGACVLRMDHHCGILGCCIGLYNHGYFIRTLFFLVNTIVLTIKHEILLIRTNTCLSCNITLFFIVRMYFYITLFGLIFFFLIYSLGNILQGKTTIDCLRDKSKKEMSIENFAKILGTKKGVWFFPIFDGKNQTQFCLSEKENIHEGIRYGDEGYEISSKFLLENEKKFRMAFSTIK